MTHFVKTKNLPVSIEQIRSVWSTLGPTCAECKSRFYKPTESHLIKASQRSERCNVDFNGPLPSNNKNRYFLTVVEGFLLPHRVVMLALQLLSSHSALYFQFLGCQCMSILTEDNLSCLEN